jgi:hypothetical protein
MRLPLRMKFTKSIHITHKTINYGTSK